eukprot:PhM_4_TR391/c0_g1_i2/m.49626
MSQNAEDEVQAVLTAQPDNNCSPSYVSRASSTSSSSEECDPPSEEDEDRNPIIQQQQQRQQPKVASSTFLPVVTSSSSSSASASSPTPPINASALPPTRTLQDRTTHARASPLVVHLGEDPLASAIMNMKSASADTKKPTSTLRSLSSSSSPSSSASSTSTESIFAETSPPPPPLESDEFNLQRSSDLSRTASTKHTKNEDKFSKLSEHEQHIKRRERLGIMHSPQRRRPKSTASPEEEEHPTTSTSIVTSPPPLSDTFVDRPRSASSRKKNKRIKSRKKNKKGKKGNSDNNSSEHNNSSSSGFYGASEPRHADQWIDAHSDESMDLTSVVSRIHIELGSLPFMMMRAEAATPQDEQLEKTVTEFADVSVQVSPASSRRASNDHGDHTLPVGDEEILASPTPPVNIKESSKEIDLQVANGYHPAISLSPSQKPAQNEIVLVDRSQQQPTDPFASTRWANETWVPTSRRMRYLELLPPHQREMFMQDPLSEMELRCAFRSLKQHR